MTVEESLWIKEKLGQLDLPPKSFILDIGSSTRGFRRFQSHIEENILSPLEEKGFNVVHMDKRSGDGINIVGDIEDPMITQKIARRFNVVVCTSLLEHVISVERTAANIANLVLKGSYLLVTVPHKWPKHNDPIDNLYRPSDKELQELFSKYARFEVFFSEILDIRNRKHYVDKSRYPLWGYRKFRFWRYYFKSFRWKMSCLLVKIS